jgi:hypothetical protein
VLASNVVALQFNFTFNGGGENGYEGYAEIDVLGAAATTVAAAAPAITNWTYSHTSGTVSFNLTGSSGQTVIVETCTNLSAPAWLPVQTNTLNGGTAVFSAPINTKASGQYYRLYAP